MNTYQKDVSRLRYAAPSTYCCVLGGFGIFTAVMVLLARYGLAHTLPISDNLHHWLGAAATALLIFSVVSLTTATMAHHLLPDSAQICQMVRQRLYSPQYGNPLHLRAGMLLPRVSCKRVDHGSYDLKITAESCTVEDIVDAASSISASLKRKYARYAVTQINADIACNMVVFRLEDVLVDRSLTYHTVTDMVPDGPTKLQVQQGTAIDLTTSGSILIAGKTRSGKTQGIIALLLSVLLVGRDDYGSEIIIIDPKQAELSRLPYTVTLDEEGEARGILNALARFADTVKNRQRILNDLSVETGDAIKWWNAGMHPSFVVIDEYVALRSVFPTKPSKDDPKYCLATFDALIKRIITMGASAGCFAIVSIAEASVVEGGLPAMLRAAMSTKVLFRPTVTEGRLLWDSDKLASFMNSRVYGPGDAWFSSTDGIHDMVSYVHFPRLEFPAYRELGRLLNEYYQAV